MAVEIKELVIRAVLTEDDRPNGESGNKAAISPEETDRIVTQCVQQVLKILTRKKAR